MPERGKQDRRRFGLLVTGLFKRCNELGPDPSAYRQRTRYADEPNPPHEEGEGIGHKVTLHVRAVGIKTGR